MNTTLTVIVGGWALNEDFVTFGLDGNMVEPKRLGLYVADTTAGTNYLGDSTCGMNGDLRYFSSSKGRNDYVSGSTCGKSEC